MLKRGRASLEQALAAVEAYQQVPLSFVEVDIAQALALSARLNIYAYDAYLLACAQQQGCPLLSLDGGLKYATGQEGIPVVSLEA